MDELVNEMANADTALGDFSDKLTNDPASLKVPEEKMKESPEFPVELVQLKTQVNQKSPIDLSSLSSLDGKIQGLFDDALEKITNKTPFGPAGIG